jgi:hypothetical protein
MGCRIHGIAWACLRAGGTRHERLWRLIGKHGCALPQPRQGQFAGVWAGKGVILAQVGGDGATACYAYRGLDHPVLVDGPPSRQRFRPGYNLLEISL